MLLNAKTVPNSDENRRDIDEINRRGSSPSSLPADQLDGRCVLTDVYRLFLTISVKSDAIAAEVEGIKAENRQMCSKLTLLKKGAPERLPSAVLGSYSATLASSKVSSDVPDPQAASVNFGPQPVSSQESAGHGASLTIAARALRLKAPDVLGVDGFTMVARKW